MGKGSQRRPGTGYAENWERVFGKKQPDPCVSDWPPATSEAAPTPSDILLTGMMLDRNRCYFEIKPAIEGRVPTPWMVDHMHDFTVEQFYDKSLTEDDLKRILFERNGVDA